MIKRIKELSVNRGRFTALPIKFFAVFSVLLLLSGCSSKVKTPEIKTEFEAYAVCKTENITYKCKIVKTESFVSVTVLDTNAEGLVMKTDGITVIFKKESMNKSFPAKNIDSTNPALMLYRVFTSLETAKITENGNRFDLKGKTESGSFVLTVSESGEFKSLSLPDANTEFSFN